MVLGTSPCAVILCLCLFFHSLRGSKNGEVAVVSGSHTEALPARSL